MVLHFVRLSLGQNVRKDQRRVPNPTQKKGNSASVIVVGALWPYSRVYGQGDRRGLGSTFIPRRDSGRKKKSVSQGQKPVYVRFECAVVFHWTKKKQKKTQHQNKVRLRLHRCGDLCVNWRYLINLMRLFISQQFILEHLHRLMFRPRMFGHLLAINPTINSSVLWSFTSSLQQVLALLSIPSTCSTVRSSGQLPLMSWRCLMTTALCLSVLHSTPTATSSLASPLSHPAS